MKPSRHRRVAASKIAVCSNAPNVLAASLNRHQSHVLESHFQPIFSLAHRRVVGHEALLRATGPDGKPVSPKDLFGPADADDNSSRLDEKCRSLHAKNFSTQGNRPEWLFLNVDVSLLAKSTVVVAALMEKVCSDSGLRPNQIVIEVLEDAVGSGVDLELQTRTLRQMGFLIAIDDFGAGHSNFDRVFKLNPTIVKLDRSVIVRASLDQTVRRATAQMVSLLHECGALVLIEGIEKREEALIALDSDADLVQGYYFGRPAAEMVNPSAGSSSLNHLWTSCDERWHHQQHEEMSRLAPYIASLLAAKLRLQEGLCLEDACANFLELDAVDVCFLLDARGFQVGPSVFPVASDAIISNGCEAFSPLLKSEGACWSRRPYFRRAVDGPDEVHVSRPYLAMISREMCVTLSICFRWGRENHVLCGDVRWDSGPARRDFAPTDAGLLMG